MLLQLEGVTAGYGPVVALRGADLHVAEGEVVALVGPNGAGKTTLLSSVVGLVRPRAGRVTFDGREVTGSRPEDCARAGLVLVPERRRIFGSLTVAENLRLAGVARSARMSADEKADRTMLLDLFPVLADRLDTRAGFLSGGEAQQLAIARGVIAAPRLLLLDEPSLGLAPRVVDSVFELLGELRTRGFTLLIVEQNAYKALAIADRAYVLRSGELADRGDAKQLLQEADLLSEYLGARRGSKAS